MNASICLSFAVSSSIYQDNEGTREIKKPFAGETTFNNQPFHIFQFSNLWNKQQDLMMISKKSKKVKEYQCYLTLKAYLRVSEQKENNKGNLCGRLSDAYKNLVTSEKNMTEV